MIEYIVIGIACLLVGLMIGLLIERSKTSVGTLIVDETDPMTDVYRIEIDNLDVIPKKKRILLKVSCPHK